MAERAEDKRNPLLVREGGVPYAPATERDPLEAWTELMEVVEALCPRWPERRNSHAGAGWRL